MNAHELLAPFVPDWEWIAGMPDDQYHGEECQDFVSSSELRTLLSKSPAHLQAARRIPHKETPALILGKALHARVLEPDTYSERFTVAPKVDRRTKAGKQAWQEFTDANPGATILSENDAGTLENMAAAIDAHPLGQHLFKHGAAELTGLYRDPSTQVPCKFRPDYCREQDGILLDLKTTLDASPAAFERSIQQYGYHFQAAMYWHGFYRVTGTPAQDFLFVVVEKQPPYAVAVYRIDEQSLNAGRRQYRKALDAYARCLNSDLWPAYSDHVEATSLPAWALSQHDMENQDNADQ
jgi:hypothetical protein